VSKGLVIAVTPTSFGVADPAPLERLKATGATLVFNQQGRALSEDEAAVILAGADGVIAGSEPLTAAVMAVEAATATVSRVTVRTVVGCTRSDSHPPTGRMSTASSTKPAILLAASVWDNE